MKFGVFPLRAVSIGAVVLLLICRELSERWGRPLILWIGVGVAMALLLGDLFVWLTRDLDK